jgi:hypothetical protein
MINFGATFVRMMDKVLEGFDEFADSFIDDIGIFSDTWEFHVEHLNAFCVVSDHLTLFGTFFFVRSVKGTDMSENCGMNFL